MSVRELVVLGSASAVPTRHRNHNGYLLRWDGQGVLFDPGEGTQRQMIMAGLAANDITWMCVTHFHGDHCLGVPGLVQRIARDGVAHPVHAVFPASGARYWERLRHATPHRESDVIVEMPVAGERATLATGDPFTLTARLLSHPVEAYGYRLAEPDGMTMLPERLAELGVRGPLVHRLQVDGQVVTPDGRTVTLEECAVRRPGQKVAFVMDTRLCDGVYELADGVDLLVIESTFLDEEAELAADYGHLTAGQAAEVAKRAGVGRLVLTHFSERYRPSDEPRFVEQAARVFDGEITLVHDLDRIPLPPRRAAVAGD
ncbi:ribonuclease Z [Spirillospora sp. NPDC052269]